MILRYFVALLLGVLLAAAVEAGPLQPVEAKRHRIEPGESLRIKLPFRGGERACVLVEGDHNPPMKITVKVYEEQTNRLVGSDEYEDYCAVIWYPPVHAEYRIEVTVHGTVYNECFIAVK